MIEETSILGSAKTKRRWNARFPKLTFSFAELNPEKLLLSAHHVRNKKEGKTTVLKNASLRNYDITEVCFSMTSQ